MNAGELPAAMTMASSTGIRIGPASFSGLSALRSAKTSGGHGMSAERTPLETIRSQQLALRQQIRALEEVFAEPDGAAEEYARKTLALLEGFDSALRDHFAVEEEGGYFADVLKVAPRPSNPSALP